MFTKIQFAPNLARLFLVFLIRMNKLLDVFPKWHYYFLVFLLLGLVFIFIPFRLGSAIIFQDTFFPKPPPKKFPQGWMVAPTDSALKIAGNFGEIRPNHFHAGLDVKTAGREGLNIYAIADGYVSRIKISAFGYGKAVYITHPNGYVSVYAHLQKLHGKLAAYLKEEQYKAEKFEIELFPDSNLLRVKQCDTIAISGNTGGSQSPHLHFEIRDAKTEHAYNPFLFGYKIDDTIPPVISLLKIYPATDSSFVNGKNTPRKIPVYGKRRKCRLSSAEKIIVSGDIGFGIETTDYGNIKEAGKLGAYSIDLYVDNKQIYFHKLDEIAFDESRYINSHIDYAEEAKSNKEIQKCFRDENNMLSIYQCVVNEGLFHFNDTFTHSVKFIVKDFFGNTSELNFKVKSQKRKTPIPKTQSEKSNHHFNCSEINKFETENIKVEIPPCALYSDMDFDYSLSKDTLPGKLAPVHSVHKQDIPVHATYSLSIKTKPIDEKLRSKATIVLLDGNNYMTDQKGEYKDGWMTTQTKYFGKFAVALDTVSPSIKPHNIYFGKNMSKAKTISVIISDNLTGIKSYHAAIDGKWVLMEYEYKKSMLFYTFDEYVTEGKHIFEVEVTDGKNNSRTYKTQFMR